MQNILHQKYESMVQPTLLKWYGMCRKLVASNAGLNILLLLPLYGQLDAVISRQSRVHTS